ncbi:MAG TPA: VacJ family lipoprotein [Oligoflexia bacterium]|nr:VacJ family lipoprotein [Oligoflexia bacterium]HMP48688.1 VacJ family lipoprotein [Oligoflexia bacterium]
MTKLLNSPGSSNKFSAYILRIVIPLKFFIIATLISSLNLKAEEINDPLEPLNRKVFWLNDKLDVYFLEPVAEGYDFVVPIKAQESVTNFFRNLDSTIWITSDIIQFNFSNVGIHSARFLINTLLGFYGTFDVADKHFGMKPVEDDIGTALGRLGISSGPYIVLPFFGPSSIRDALSLGAEAVLSPTVGLAYTNLQDRSRNIILGGANSLRIVNLRSKLLEPVKAAKGASIDYYAFTRAAYHQRREARINGNDSKIEHEEMSLDDEFDIPEDE